MNTHKRKRTVTKITNNGATRILDLLDLPDSILVDFYRFLMGYLNMTQTAWLLSITCKRFNFLSGTISVQLTSYQRTYQVTVRDKWKHEREEQRRTLYAIIVLNIGNNFKDPKQLYKMQLNQLLNIIYDPRRILDYMRLIDYPENCHCFHQHTPCECHHIFHDGQRDVLHRAPIIISYQHFLHQIIPWNRWQLKNMSSDHIQTLAEMDWVDKKLNPDMDGWTPAFFSPSGGFVFKLDKKTGGKDAVTGIEHPDPIVRKCAENSALSDPISNENLVDDNLTKEIRSRLTFDEHLMMGKLGVELTKCYGRSVLFVYHAMCGILDTNGQPPSFLYEEDILQQILLREYLLLFPHKDHLQVPLERQPVDALYERLIRFIDSINEAPKNKKFHESLHQTHLTTSQ